MPDGSPKPKQPKAKTAHQHGSLYWRHHVTRVWKETEIEKIMGWVGLAVIIISAFSGMVAWVRPTNPVNDPASPARIAAANAEREAANARIAAAQAEALAAARILETLHPAIQPAVPPPTTPILEKTPSIITPPFNPTIIEKPPSQTSVSDPKRLELVAWSERGFNATTIRQVPVAILAPNGDDPTHFQDKNAVRGLTFSLTSDLHIVSLQDAALFLEITDAHADATDTAQPCTYPYSTWVGSAQITVQAFWIGEKVLLVPKTFSGAGTACGNRDLAANHALDYAISKITDAVLDSAKTPISATNQ